MVAKAEQNQNKKKRRTENDLHQAQQNKRQIIYFPYIFLGRVRSVTFLDVTVRHLEEVLNGIKEDNLKAKIQNLMDQNRVFGKPIKGIGIIDIKGRDGFRLLKPGEANRIRELSTVLFLVGMAKCNIEDGPNVGHLMLTSDNFRIVFQNFVLDSPYTGYTSGKIVKTSDFGYTISEITYEKPPYVLQNPFSCDENFLKMLEQLRRKSRKTYRLILRATEAVMNAYTNSEDVSNGSRILELSRAFEILFELPETNQRKAFKETINKYCTPPGEKKRRYLSERLGSKKEPEKGSRQFMWADRFYVLRNHIIHGENIPHKSYFFYGQPHHHLGLWFFLVSVKKIINESMGKTIFYDTIKCKSDKFVYDNGLLKVATARAIKEIFKKEKWEYPLEGI
jgi:hypothetical protein